MRKVLGILVLIIFPVFLYGQQTTTIEGIYRGENLIIHNPFDPDGGVLFCIYEVNVNGKTFTNGINSSSFEIDFAALNIMIGDKLNIKFKQRKLCGKVEVVNSAAIMPKSTFQTVSIGLDKFGNLKWKTKGEAGSLPFVVEQFRWNKWKKIGTVNGKGTPGTNSYSYKVKLHSGMNRVRVKQVDYTKKPAYSSEAKVNPGIPKVSFSQKGKTILFSAPTSFEVYNGFGKIVETGYAAKIDISKYSKGDYYLNYDNLMGEFSR